MAISVWFWIGWSVMFVAVVVILWIWLTFKLHPFKVRIRELTSTNTRLIYDTHARIKVDEEKVEYLKLLNKRGGHDKLPLPPPEAIDHDLGKKKKIIEVYYSDETGYIYIEDGGLVKGFQPLTTKQRLMMVNEMRKKEERKKNRWQDNIPLIVGSMTIVAILAVLLLFWGEAVKPMMDYGNQQTKIHEKQMDIWDKMTAYERGAQIVDDSPAIVQPPPM